MPTFSKYKISSKVLLNRVGGGFYYMHNLFLVHYFSFKVEHLVTRCNFSDLRHGQARGHGGGQPRGRAGRGQRGWAGKAADPGPQHLQPQGAGEGHGHGRRHQGEQGGRGAHPHQVIILFWFLDSQSF